MADDTTPSDTISYETLVRDALRHVVKDVLMRTVAAGGLPGEHHFFITFQTTAPGVEIGDQLKAEFPEEMTVVLQHQFWDLAVTPERFSVKCAFGGVPRELIVPFSAITAFFDPSVQFGLQFTAPPAQQTADAQADDAAPDPAAADTSGDAQAGNAEAGATAAEDAASKDEPGEVVSLDAFRKK